MGAWSERSTQEEPKNIVIDRISLPSGCKCFPMPLAYLRTPIQYKISKTFPTTGNSSSQKNSHTQKPTLSFQSNFISYTPLFLLIFSVSQSKSTLQYTPGRVSY